MTKKTKRATNKGLRRAVYTYGSPSGDGRNSTGLAMVNKSHAEQVHAMINPFSAESKGAKLPDEDSTRSAAVQIKWKKTIDVNSSGVATANFAPWIAEVFTDQNTGVAGSQITNWNSRSTTPDYTALASSFGSYRIVSWGVRVVDLRPPTGQQGSIRLITSFINPSSPQTTLDVTGGYFEEVEDFPCYGSDIYWVSKPVGVGFKEYRPITDEHSWENLTLYGDGMGSAYNNALLCEVVFNLEVQPKLSAIGAGLANRAADHNPRSLAAADHARNRHKNAQRQPSSGPSIGNQMWELAKRGLIAAAETFGAPIVGRALQNLMGTRPRPLAIEVD